jgi:hypothetical protein
MSWRVRAWISAAVSAAFGITTFTLLPATATQEENKPALGRKEAGADGVGRGRGLKRKKRELLDQQRQQMLARAESGQRVVLTRSDFESPPQALTEESIRGSASDPNPNPNPNQGSGFGPDAQRPTPKKANKGIRGRITRLIPNGFELRYGGKGAALPTTLRVTVNSGTQLLEVRKGAATDVKPEMMVAIQGEPPTSGKMQATSVVALWPASPGAVGLAAGEDAARDETRRALMVAAGARRALGDVKKREEGSGKRGEEGAAKPMATQLATGKATEATAQKKKPTRPTLGRVVSLNPLTVMVKGEPVTIATTKETRFASTRPITLKGLKVGEGVALSIQGEAEVPPTPGQASDVVAALIVKSPGAQTRQQVEKKAVDAKKKFRRQNRITKQ